MIVGLVADPGLCKRRYNDDNFEYRHVQLPKQMLKKIPKEYFDGSRGTLKLLWEEEWRGLGITQVGTAGRDDDARLEADVYCRVWGGNTTRYMSRSRTFCSSSMCHRRASCCFQSQNLC